MIKKSERIGRSRFKEKPLQRRSFSFGTVVLLQGTPGASVVISKKICKSAVGRNRLRRRIYSVLRPLFRNGTLKRAVVVHPNKTALSLTFSTLREALLSALPKSNL